MNTTALIIMAKEPKIGATKTRLCPPLSLQEAAKLYDALLRDTIALVAQLPTIDLAIAVTPPDSTAYFENISPAKTHLIPVACKDIGDCLAQVISQLIKQGYTKVIAFNTDGPSLPPEIIQKAVYLLDKHDLVFGPAEDGGYYLVGQKQYHPNIFTQIDWSTSRVLKQTLAKTAKTGLNIALLPSWYDIDTIDDIERLHTELKTLAPHKLIHTRRFFEQWPGKTGE